jgi:hypothetical protein
MRGDDVTERARQLSEELRRELESLQTLRDEVRVRVHLAGMDVRRRWSELEPRIDDLLDSAKRLGEASVEAVREALRVMRELRKDM